MRPLDEKKGLAIVGSKIAEVRRSRGWTQEDFARRIGASYKHAQKIEYGKVNISLVALFRIANVLQIPATRLLDPAAAEPKPVGRPPQARSKAGPYQPSRYIGVHGQWGLWYARVTDDNGERYRLGPFKTQREAAKAHDAAARSMRGDRARLNFPSHYH